MSLSPTSLSPVSSALSLPVVLEGGHTSVEDVVGAQYEGLNESARRGDLAAVITCAKAGLSLNVRVKPYFWSPLHMAAREGKLDVVKVCFLVN